MSPFRQLLPRRCSGRSRGCRSRSSPSRRVKEASRAGGRGRSPLFSIPGARSSQAKLFSSCASRRLQPLPRHACKCSSRSSSSVSLRRLSFWMVRPLRRLRQSMNSVYLSLSATTFTRTDSTFGIMTLAKQSITRKKATGSRCATRTATRSTRGVTFATLSGLQRSNSGIKPCSMVPISSRSAPTLSPQLSNLLCTILCVDTSTSPIATAMAFSASRVRSTATTSRCTTACRSGRASAAD
mmetsp:Transcript_29573/g.96303  ORF Transcript_29573/g.96303 Transcript_29573/m.96303 type:complete len:240 (-) Transcript_29573:5255-5974(-)